jgi:methionine synthase II (cobalamin-independent)
MAPQVSGGLPGAFIDERSGKLVMDPAAAGIDRAEALAGFFEKVLAGEVESFDLTPGEAAGYHELLRRLRSGSRRASRLKGQVTGPVTFGLSAAGPGGNPVWFDRELREAAVAGIAAKASAQARALGRFARSVMIFIDEPVLSGYGSSTYVGLERSEVVAAVDAVADGARREGALVGLHCCGNTDWGMIAECRLDVISFDAYEYTRGLALYRGELGAFLARGGALAYGIVPTSDAVSGESAESLVERLAEGIDLLASKGLPREALVRRSMLTPSCGCGTLAAEAAKRVFELLVETAELARRRLAP